MELSAADMSKLAMLKIATNQELRELGFRSLFPVHDEIIGECPIENAKEAGERLSYLMRTAPTHLIKLPFKCDISYTMNWYGEELII